MSPVSQLAIPAFNRRRFFYLSAGAATAAVYVTRPGLAGANTPNPVTAANDAFLDAGVVHQIVASFEQGAYDAMVETFLDSSKKEWISATVSIDGSTYYNVGMRLKGNSSLGGAFRMADPEDAQDTPADSTDQATPVAAAEESDGASFTDQPGPGGNFEEPAGLPWLIRLDKYVDDQRHRGVKDLVIRSNNSATSLNEAVALDLIAEAGLASQLAAATGFSVNGSDPVLRLAVELPNDDWMTLRFDADGLLYKGEATGDYSYRGDDPDSYADVFEVEAGDIGDSAENMKPLIEFLDFINNSDDEDFAAAIADRFDVPQYGVYKATMNLINNFDDISGPGNNGYLYYDPETGQFTIVPWDMNLAFGGLGGGPNGGPGGGNGPQMFINGEPVDPSDGFEPPPGAETRSAFGTPVAGFSGPSDGPNSQVGGPGGILGPKTNPLVERIPKIAEYTTLIDDETTRLRVALYDSGKADEFLARWVDVLKQGAGTMVDEATITSESDAIAEQFTKS